MATLLQGAGPACLLLQLATVVWPSNWHAHLLPGMTEWLVLIGKQPVHDLDRVVEPPWQASLPGTDRLCTCASHSLHEANSLSRLPVPLI